MYFVGLPAFVTATCASHWVWSEEEAIKSFNLPVERPAKSSSWCKGHENVFPTMGLVVKYLYLHTVWWKNCQVIPCETTHPAVGNSKLQSNYELWPVVRAWLVPLPNFDGVIKQITVKTREMDVTRTHFDVNGPWKPWKVPHKKNHRENAWNGREKTTFWRERTVKTVKAQICSFQQLFGWTDL